MPHEQHAAIKLWVQPMPIHGVAALVVAVGPGYVIIYSTYIYIYTYIYIIYVLASFSRPQRLQLSFTTWESAAA